MSASIVELHRSLDQELIAILRKASLECPVCGEFLLHRSDGIGCPQCRLELGGTAAERSGLELAGEAAAAERLTDTPAL